MAREKVTLEVQPTMCKTCPWRKGSQFAYLKEELEQASMREGRVCHSTGNSVIYGPTGKRRMICRGSRNFQLRMFVSLGFLSEAIDAAWEAKCVELGIKANQANG